MPNCTSAVAPVACWHSMPRDAEPPWLRGPILLRTALTRKSPTWPIEKYSPTKPPTFLRLKESPSSPATAFNCFSSVEVAIKINRSHPSDPGPSSVTPSSIRISHELLPATVGSESGQLLILSDGRLLGE